MNSFAYGPANTHQRHARQLPRRAAILCLFHPDCNRWSRILTGSAKRAKRGGRLICSGRGLPAWHACLLVTASGESHPALKQNSSSAYCMREGDRLQPLCGKFLEKGGDGAIRGWRPACPVSRKRVTRRKGVPIPNLNLDETRGKHASSIFGRSIREAARKASARSLAVSAKCSAMQLRRNARPHDDEHPKAALRHDAPNPRAAPANFFCCAVAAQKRGLFARFFEGEDPRPRTRRSRFPWFSVSRVCLRVSAVGKFYARCRYCGLASPGMLYIIKAV